MEIRRLSGPLGAEVWGLDLAQALDADAPAGRALAEVRAALATHKVLAFRDQDLTPAQQIALTERLGGVLRLPFIEPLPDHPEIIAVLKDAAERDIATFGGSWHSDFTFLAAPPSHTLLYALELPPTGGDTIWADMTQAYATLSDGMKGLLRGLRGIHGAVPHGTRGPPASLRVSTSVKMARNDPAADAEVAHPVVRRHPDTGAAALFVNPVYVTRFEDMTEAESKPLIETLQGHATRPEMTCRLTWNPGTLAIWDNRCTQHLAVNDYDGYRRLLHRTTVVGERPLPAA
jgi:taurine dioxygenase